MRTIVMLFGLFCLVLLGAPAFGQEAPTPTAEEFRQQAETLKLIADAKAQLAALEAAKVAEPVHVNSPRRHHVYVDACGVQILNQPANGRHTERMMAQSNDCARTQVAQTDADTRRVEVLDRGDQGDTMTAAMAAAIVDSKGAANTYADTQNGQYATGAAAVQAARGFNSFDGSSFNGWVEGQAWANQLLNGSAPAPAPVVTNQAPAPKKVVTVPSTPTPSAKDKADKALADALKE